MRGPAGLAALMLMPILLAACQSDAAPSGAAVPFGEYVLIDMGGQDVESSHVTLVLEAGLIRGSGFCNSYHGAQSATLPALAIGPIASTRMACPGDRMAQDQTYMQALGAATSASLVGNRLTVSGGASDLVYRAYMPD